jgi:hypothetical protein
VDFEVPAEADGPMKIVKDHHKPGAEALGGKSAATGVCECVRECECVCVCVRERERERESVCV